MNPLNIVNTISDIIDSLAETTPARLRSKSLWHKRRAIYWDRQHGKAKTPKRGSKCHSKLEHHANLAALYAEEASKMEEREDE